MSIIVDFLKKVKKFRTFPFRDKLLILKAFFITGIMRIVLIVIPFCILKKYMGECGKESPVIVDNIDYYGVQKISWAINMISRYTPWESRCFVQALTAQRLLRDRGFESTLYFGVSKSLNNEMIDAHAWIRCGNIYVTGGDGNKFSIVARFRK